MKFYDAITKNTIRDEINRICGVTDEVYSLRDKLARVNQALDRYWSLASAFAPEGSFDDTNQSTAPIETQSLADGTNAYKVGDFTNEVLQILRMTVLQDDGITEVDLYREAFDDYSEFLQHYSTATADKGDPSFWTKYGDYIYIRPTPDYSETNGLRAYVNRELSKYTPTTFTTTNASNQIDATAHGLSDGDTVILSTAGVIPNGYTADTQIYFVRDKATDSFKVALTHTGTAVTIDDDGTGLHQFFKLSKVPGIPVIHHDYLARYASQPFLIEERLSQANFIAQRIGQDEQSIEDYWQGRGRDLPTIIRPQQRVYK